MINHPVHTGDPKVMARDLMGLSDEGLRHLAAAIAAERNRRTREHTRKAAK